MGYRSEVILAVGPEVMPQFMVTMAKSPEARKLCWSEADNMIQNYAGIKGAFLFRCDPWFRFALASVSHRVVKGKAKRSTILEQHT